MISTSFLRTLNLKKYQDFTEENKNRLKVFYTRTLNRMNKNNQKENKVQKLKTNRCLCKSNPDFLRPRAEITSTSNSEIMKAREKP